LYVACSASGNKCKFFNWADLPLTEKYLKWVDEEKDLPQVSGNTWGQQFTEEELQLLRSIKGKNRVGDNITTTNTVVSPPIPPTPAPPKYSDSEKRWRAILESARYGRTGLF